MQGEKKENERLEANFEIELGEPLTQKTLRGEKTILFKKQVQQQIDEFAASDTDRELGGVLLGIPEERNEGVHLAITAMLKAKKTAVDKTTLTFTHETWNQIHHEIDILYPELKIVGWFHSHPGRGVSLSNYDLFIQQKFFNLPWQVTYVVDPVNKENGFFAWEGDEIKPSHYRVVNNGQEMLISLPLEKIPAPTAPAIAAEEDGHEPVKTSNWYKVMLIVMGLLLIFTNVHRLDQPEIDHEDQEALLARERQIETLRTELNHQEEKVASLQNETMRLEELVNQLSGEYFNVYTVIPGDTLWSISDRFYDDPSEYEFIMRLNDLDDPDSLEVGQDLILYKKK